jgi:hypothetical protein
VKRINAASLSQWTPRNHSSHTAKNLSLLGLIRVKREWDWRRDDRFYGVAVEWWPCASTNAVSFDEFAMKRAPIFWLGMMPVGKAVFLR